MKIKPLGYRIIDEESGMIFEVIPKTKEATQEFVEEFFDSFKILKVETSKIEPLREEKKPPRKPKSKRPKSEKKVIPNPVQRHIKELTDLPEEFTIGDIGDLFEKDGYDRKKIIDNSYHDINDLIDKNKIIYIEGTKPKKYKIVSRDTSDLG
ncbi:MAG: hypothetical protein OIN88_04335 [Candidatus Methanoperedens sp.]|nr:hypothetical protein [Candidatus Methanoperedens sp.]MCZ7361102.1 hypothetical protein [Candidatus Methanoperedens sp.]